MRRAAVIGPALVARTATTVATVAVVAHGVNQQGGQAGRPQRPATVDALPSAGPMHDHSESAGPTLEALIENDR